MKPASRNFLSLAGPISPGGMQQAVLNAKPATTSRRASWYMQGIGRVHTQLGMMRLIRVVKVTGKSPGGNQRAAAPRRRRGPHLPHHHNRGT